MKLGQFLVLSFLVFAPLPVGAQDDPNNPDETGPTVLGDFFKKVFDVDTSDVGEKDEQKVDDAAPAAATSGQKDAVLASDKLSYQAAVGQVMELSRTGNLNHWRNPATGVHGTITPTRTIKTDGKPCRAYDSTWIVDGKTQAYTGIACRKGKGRWPVREEKKVTAAADTPWVSPDAVSPTDTRVEIQPDETAGTQPSENVPDDQSTGNQDTRPANKSEIPTQIKDAKDLLALFKGLTEGNRRGDRNRNDNPTTQDDSGDQNSGDNAPFDPDAVDNQVSGEGVPFDPNAADDQVSGDGAPFDPNAADDQVSGDGAPFDPNAADDQVSGDGAPFDPNATGDQASNDGVPFDPNAADDQASSNDLHQGANDVHPPSSPPLVRHPPVHRPPPRTRVIPAPRFSKVVLLNRRGAVQLRFHSVRGAQKYQARLVSPRRQAFWRRDLKTPVVTFGPRLSQQLKRRFPRQPGRISLRAMVGGQWGRWSSTKTFVFPKAIAKRRVSPRPIHTSRPRVGNRSGNPRVSPRRPRQASALQPYRFAAYLVVLSQGRGEPGKTSEYKGYVFAALCSGGKQITPTVRVMRRKDKTWEAKTRARSRTKGATWRLSNQQFSSGRVAVWGSITEKDTGKNTTLRGPATRFAQACQAGGTASNRKGRATFSARAGDRIQLNWHLNPAKR